MEMCMLNQKSEYIIGYQMINLITQLLCSAQMREENCHEGFYFLISPGIRWLCGNNFLFPNKHKEFI